jgi:hypothetical protein
MLWQEFDMRHRSLILGLLVALAVAGCAKRTYPPGDPGVCFHAVTGPEGGLKFNKLSADVPNLETCAANLEAMRIRFLRMGGNKQEIMGAYQGNFIFLQRQGIFTAPSLESNRYLVLVRTGDGRLAIPGAVAQWGAACATDPHPDDRLWVRCERKWNIVLPGAPGRGSLVNGREPASTES